MLCIAYSENCKLFYVFTVHRPFRPEPPVASEVHATSCTVTYQPPSDDGGAPVTGYVLERCTPGPDSKWITVNHTPVVQLLSCSISLAISLPQQSTSFVSQRSTRHGQVSSVKCRRRYQQQNLTKQLWCHHRR